jgi:DNA-binding Lrp family transcriptional regulator
VLDTTNRALIALIQDGLPIDPRPFAHIAEQLGIDEQEVIQRIEALRGDGVITRFGVVVRHHELGYRANAMVVWDVPDDRVDEVGKCLGDIDCITLCYRRPRRLPMWPYNLFCMIHGKDRQRVLARLKGIVAGVGLEDVDYKVLFSGRRFKQRGARYMIAT